MKKIDCQPLSVFPVGHLHEWWGGGVISVSEVEPICTVGLGTQHQWGSRGWSSQKLRLVNI